MKTKMWRHALVLCLVSMAMVACSNDDDKVDDIVSLKGVWVLNEGSYNANNAGISFYNPVTGATVLDLTDGKLGDTAQDILQYGSHLFVSVSGSEYISIIDLHSKEEVKKIDKLNDSPRYMVAHNGKVYASVYNTGIIEIDTLSFAVKHSTGELGKGLEGVAVSGGKLYVAVSNGGEYGNLDNRVAVLSLPTLSLEKHITVNKNPYYLQADTKGNVYLSSQDVWSADYSTIENAGKLQKIVISSGVVEDILSSMVLKFILQDNACIFFDYAKVGVVQLDTKKESTFITDDTEIGTPYGIGIDPLTQEVYLAGTDYLSPGKVHIFNQAGKVQKQFNAGINPNGFAFYY